MSLSLKNFKSEFSFFINLNKPLYKNTCKKERILANQIYTDNNLKETPLCNLYAKGSYTIEAAFILPISLFMLVFFLYFFPVMYVQWGVTSVLNQVAREYASVSIDKEDNYSWLIIGKCTSEIMSKDRMKNEIIGGVFGLDFTESEFEKNYINIKVNYRLRNPITFFGKKDIRLTSVASSRKWVGYDPLEDSEGGEYVFVTEYGTVYHNTLNCTYLKPSVKAVSASSIKNTSSVVGGKYSSCMFCKGNKNNGVVYITDYGDVYHSKLSCGAIKRTIKRVKKDSIGGMSGCSKCA